VSAAALVKAFENCRLQAYQDLGLIWTIGWGHTNGVYPGQTCTQSQADAWLDQDLQIASYELLQYSPGPFAPGAQDALIDFVFNLGIGNYRLSTLRQLVDAQQWAAVKTELLKWDHVGGVVVPGLLRRRQAEADLIQVPA